MNSPAQVESRRNERQNSLTLSDWKFEGGKFKKWKAYTMALLSLATGSLITGRLAHIDPSRSTAD